MKVSNFLENNVTKNKYKANCANLRKILRFSIATQSHRSTDGVKIEGEYVDGHGYSWEREGKGRGGTMSKSWQDIQYILI